MYTINNSGGAYYYNCNLGYFQVGLIIDKDGRYYMYLNIKSNASVVAKLIYL